MKRFSLIIVLLLLLSSCEFFGFKSGPKKTRVARVLEQELYASDLANVVPDGMSKKDSMVLAKAYINTWAKQQLMLHKSELNLSAQASDFEALVREYRESLFINAYKQGIVQEYLDTVVTSTEIENFYLNNEENFRLNENLVKFRLVSLESDRQDVKEVEKMFKRNDSLSKESLKELEMTFHIAELNEEIWIKYDDLLRRIPVLKSIDKKKFLKKDGFFEIQDSLSLYLVRVKDVKLRGDNAPLVYIQPTIKRIILQQRKLELFRNLEQTLIDDAIKNNEYEIYKK